MMHPALCMTHAEKKPDGEPVRGRARAIGTVGGSAWDAAASGVAMPDRAGRCGRRDESADRRRVSDRCEDRGAMARAIYSDRTGRLVGDRRKPWAQAHLLDAQDQGDCSSHAVEQAGGDDAVELSADGASPGREQIHDQHYLAQPQLEAAPCQELQALARCAVSGEANRCGGAVSESPRPSHGAVRGPEDPDPSSGPHAAGIAHEEGAPGHDDPRLQAQRHDLLVRCPGGPAGESGRSVLCPSPPSGVSEILATSGWGIPRPDHAALGDGQLWHPQAYQRAGVAEAPSAICSEFCTDQFQLAQPGATLVWRTHGQSRPTRLIHQRRSLAVLHRCIPGGLERKYQPLGLYRNRRVDPGQACAMSPDSRANQAWLYRASNQKKENQITSYFSDTTLGIVQCAGLCAVSGLTSCLISAPGN